MTIQKTTTDLSTLKINYLTQEMYEDALENEEINENELYITPGSGSIESTDIPTADKVAEFDSTAHMNSMDMTSSEIEDFVDGLNVAGGMETTTTELTGSYNLKAIAYRRYGIVTLCVYQTATTSLPKGAWTTVGILPEEYRPLHQLDMLGVDNNTSSVQNNTIQIRIGIGGTVQVWAYSNGATDNQLMFATTFIGGNTI